MARKKVSHSLTKLPARSALRGSDHIAHQLLELLRMAAIKNQKDQPQSFYSMREVANRLRVPISTVAGVYKRLEREGLVSRVRGSKTVLQASTMIGVYACARLSVYRRLFRVS